MFCGHFGRCGGCTYDIPYEEELRGKEAGVLEMFSRAGINTGEYLGAVPAPNAQEYRNKMEFAFGDSGKDSGLCLGVRKRRSFYEVADARTCTLVDSDFRKIAACVCDYFADAGETFFHRRRHTGSLRHLIIRKGYFTGEILVNIVTTPALSAPLAPLVETLTRPELAGRVAGILHTVNSSVADAIVCDRMDVLHGNSFFHDRLLGLSFKISAFSFFQTNSAAAELLYTAAADFAGSSTGTVFDLYCGTGTIAQIVAAKAGKVVGVESVAEAVDSARENAAANKISNVCFITGDVLKVLDELDDHPDTVILDPPRSGVVPKALAKIVLARPSNIVYVSCKPSSLVRDLQTLTQQGYRVEATKLVDLFPRTAHIEAVCLLRQV
ncbi:MAG: 23S rRNA (uracil(1939)-C(5))-methyltransferase RlmD [Defluviitaleaceae bacterium]|nr:23S rRNA (uracil(1939)-C(5))-methyltransferase RlmD [Defluviitaleaceae bacterium]